MAVKTEGLPGLSDRVLDILFGIRIGQDVAGLAVQGFADRFECGETDRPGFARFQDREVRKRDADLFGELVQAHLPLGQHDVQVYDNCHRRLLNREFLFFMDA